MGIACQKTEGPDICQKNLQRQTREGAPLTPRNRRQRSHVLAMKLRTVHLRFVNIIAPIPKTFELVLSGSGVSSETCLLAPF